MGVAAKIAEIEAEMARTQKNKATEHHFGVLKAKLAKLRKTAIATGFHRQGSEFLAITSKKALSNHASSNQIYSGSRPSSNFY